MEREREKVEKTVEKKAENTAGKEKVENTAEKLIGANLIQLDMEFKLIGWRKCNSIEHGI